MELTHHLTNICRSIGGGGVTHYLNALLHLSNVHLIRVQFQSLTRFIKHLYNTNLLSSSTASTGSCFTVTPPSAILKPNSKKNLRDHEVVISARI